MPVVDKGELVGILSVGDLLKAAVSQTGIGSVPKGLKRQQLGIGIKEGGRWSELWKA